MAEGTGTRASAFDEFAPTYDADFSGTTTGIWLREAVWSALEPFVKAGMSVLDLGCGTGEDAMWFARNGCEVTAADGSPAMLEQVAAKAARLHLTQHVETIRIDLNALEAAPPGLPFDLVLSNFGAINCIDDLVSFGRRLENWVKPDGVVALVFMGRFCAWESAYYLARFDRSAARRWTGRATAAVGSRRVTVRYWSKNDIVRALGPSFLVLAVRGIGTFLPPSYLFHWVDRRPRLSRTLARWERCAAHQWPLSRMADHMAVILRRRDTPARRSQA